MTVTTPRPVRPVLFRCLPALLVVGLLASNYFVLAQEADKSPPVPVPVESGTAKLHAHNTRIEFVGLHTGSEPKPRLGGFKKFDGLLVIDEGKLKKISVEIQIDSIWTEFDKLTQHLQAADFFNVKEYPTARFQSTKIVPGSAAGKVEVTGQLTMHGTQKSITFPAKVDINAEGVTLESEFKLDRAMFGMNEHLEGVEKLVNVSVVVGQETRGLAPADKSQADAPQQTDPPRSGLAVGQSIEPWTPVHVAGPDKGTKTCPMCAYLGRPAIVMFAKDSQNTRHLLVEIENLLARHDQQRLKGIVTVLDAAPEELEQLAADEEIELTSLCHPDPETAERDLAAYKVNPAVDNTIIVYRDYKVVATFVDLDLKQFGKVRKATEQMLE